MQVDVDRSPIHSIDDKIMTFVRNHSTGPSAMDTVSSANAKDTTTRNGAQSSGKDQWRP